MGSLPAEATGLSVDGQCVEVPGISIIGPGDAPWVRLESRDYRPRPPGTWIRQIILHTTRGVWPQAIRRGRGPGGGAKRTADYWHSSPEGRRIAGGAHLVIDSDGRVVCLADLVRAMAYHATVSNLWSVGIELYQELDGSIYEIALDAAVELVAELCELLAIPFQLPRRLYSGAPMRRMITGGPDMAGVFGHRDNTDQRGRGDPGDWIMARLEGAGGEALDFESRQDLEVWRRRQQKLRGLGEQLEVDGLPGPATMAALRRRGFRCGSDLDASAGGVGGNRR